MKSNQSISLTTKISDKILKKSSGIIFTSEEHDIDNFFGHNNGSASIQKPWIIEGKTEVYKTKQNNNRIQNT